MTAINSTIQTQTGSRADANNQASDAITLLIDDHNKVKELFKEYEKLSKKDDVEGKVGIARQICEELTTHASVEEEIFFPAARAVIEDENLLDESEVKHATAKDLIAQIQELDGNDPLYDVKLKVLSEYINHHVEQEEAEMFPKAQKANMDLEGLGIQMVERKGELQVVTA